MKRKLYFLLMIGILVACIPASGQKTVVKVNPDEGLNIGALNTAINSAANPGNTIFELKRGGVYLLNGTISHTGYTLHIRAEAGNGPRPILQPGVDALGASSAHFSPGSSIILEDLHIAGIDELGVIKGNLINVKGEGSRIVIKNCYNDYTSAAWIYLSSIKNKVFISDCIYRNGTQPASPSNGRVIDTRGNPQDTLVIENSTIYNVSAKTISGTDYVGYLKFNNTTNFQCNVTSVFALGETVKCDITNNIFYNYCMRGERNSPTHTLFTIDSVGTGSVVTNAERRFNISNNNWYTQPEFGEIIEKYGVKKNMLYTFRLDDKEHKDTIWYNEMTIRKYLFNQPVYDTIVNNPYFGPAPAYYFLKNGQIDTTNFIREPLTFKNAPPIYAEYWKVFVEKGWSMKGTTPPNMYADEDMKTIGEVTTGAYDFSFAKNSLSATGGKDGKPLGDPRWVPFTVSKAGDLNNQAATSVRAFPNPFDHTVNFEIVSDDFCTARISVFSLLGKEIFLVKHNLVKGTNLVSLEQGTGLSPGIYLYTVQSENAGGHKILSSGKLIKN